MVDGRPSFFKQSAQNVFIRLQTFIALRWVAVVGQIIAIYGADKYFNLSFDLTLCYMAIGASIVVNLVAMGAYPKNKRVSATEAAAMLIFDILQLAFLLYLTGGLNNPFALLLLAPVTVAASVLPLRAAILVGFVAIVSITIVTFIFQPLQTKQGMIIQLPPDIEIGFWLAIVIGIIFQGFYARRITSEIRSMSRALLATQMALAREQKLTDLGGVVAAAAHEMGTPLATIKLVSTEMIEDLSAQPDLRADARLIREQAERCRDILRGMGRAGKDDLHLKFAPVSAVLEEAAEPHLNRGKEVHINVIEPKSGKNPLLRREPEIIHGLRTLIQNAVDFAKANVWVEAEWHDATLLVRITDDGEGFPPRLIGRIGEPFMPHQKSHADQAQRPEYEGMGLGLFIAKTLLERSGGKLDFANCSDPFLSADERPEKCGATVTVCWPRKAVSAQDAAHRGALGANRQIR